MLKAIIYILGIIFLLRLVIKLLFPGRVNTSFTYHRPQQPGPGPQQSRDYRPEGTITVHPKGKPKTDEGEYADYEEIK